MKDGTRVRKTQRSKLSRKTEPKRTKIKSPRNTDTTEGVKAKGCQNCMMGLFLVTVTDEFYSKNAM